MTTAITIKMEIIKDSLPCVKIIYIMGFISLYAQRNNGRGSFKIKKRPATNFMNTTITKINKKR
jgi:hypothetical protein